MKILNYWIKLLLSKTGIIIRKENPDWAFVPYSCTPEGIYQNLLKEYKIDLILDIGASSGYWAGSIRANNYKHRIISFEPQDRAYNEMANEANSDPNWDVIKVALGDNDEIASFYLSTHAESSSLSQMLQSHKEAFAASQNINEKIQVSVRKLDTLLPNLLRNEVNIFAKIDVQGFEQKVLNGANESLKKIKMLQLELSFKKLYADDVLFHEIYQYMNNMGFHLIHISPGFKNEQTDELLQVDAIFAK